MVWLWQMTEGKPDRVASDFRWEATDVAGGVKGLSEIGTEGVGAVEETQGSEATRVGEAAQAGPAIVHVEGEPERWVLAVPPGCEVRINGVPVLGGVRMLRHRDLIFAGGKTFWFSTERLARVERFAGAEGAIYCGRCKRELEVDQDVVRCPGCVTLFHESGTRPCWSYREAGCAYCGYPATLDGQFQWTPAEV
jgi:hypothetical protein